MGILSKLFGSDKVIEAGMSAIDKVAYTEEEKADNNLKYQSVKIALLKAYEPFKIAQRFIALIVGIPFVSIHLALFAFKVGLLLVTVFYGGSETYDFAVKELSNMQTENNETLGEPFVWICIFYFGGGAGEGIIKHFRGIKK